MDVVHAGLVNRAKNILVTPRTEWPVIDAEPATVGSIYRNYVLILAAVPMIASLIGNFLFGYSVLGFSIRTPLVTAISGAITQYILSLASVFILALIIDALAPSFGGTKNQTQAIKVAAYSYTAAWVAGILQILPQLKAIAGLLGLYSFYLLYVGLPLLMRAPQEKALAYTVAAIVAAIVLFIVLGAVAGALSGLFAPTAPLGTTVI